MVKKILETPYDELVDALDKIFWALEAVNEYSLDDSSLFAPASFACMIKDAVGRSGLYPKIKLEHIEWLDKLLTAIRDYFEELKKKKGLSEKEVCQIEQMFIFLDKADTGVVEARALFSKGFNQEEESD